MERKLIRSGNGWALFINSTFLELLKVNPETDKVEFIMENDTLKIKKAQPAPDTVTSSAAEAQNATPAAALAAQDADSAAPNTALKTQKSAKSANPGKSSKPAAKKVSAKKSKKK